MGRRTFTFEWLTFIPALLLVSLGLVTLLSIKPQFFYQQLIFTIVGLFLFWIFSQVDFDLYHYLDRFIYVSCILFLLLSFLGPSVRGATRWLEIGEFRLQPSELIKPFFMVSLASLMVRFPPTRFRHILYQFGFLLLPALLLYLQPDLGNVIIYSAIWAVMLLISGLPMIYVVGGGLVLLLLTPFSYSILRDYQKLRLVTFLNPLTDPRGAGYNAIQSMIAVGSGKLFGRGFGRGTQSQLKFLPEHHTDFIFAAFSEAFGFVGSLLLISIFFVFLWRLLKSAEFKKTQPFACLFLSGFFMQTLVQVGINIGMNVGLVPITGITLPFVSYGGSSLLSLWITLGMAMASSKRGGL